MGYIFLGEQRIIRLTAGTTILDLVDLYSRWKDWVKIGDGSKYLPAFQVVGGEPIDEQSGIYITSYFFLINNWKIKPQEANHKLRVVNGVILDAGGGDPFLSTDGNYNVIIQFSQPVKSEVIRVTTGSGLSQQEHDKLMSLPDLNDIESEIRDEINYILKQDSSIELTSVPSVTAPLAKQIQFLFQYFKNKRVVTNNSEIMYSSNGQSQIGSADLTDNGTSFTKDEMR